jgi:hypothetical protein
MCGLQGARAQKKQMSVYLLYQYKSTNRHLLEEAGVILIALLVQKYKY